MAEPPAETFAPGSGRVTGILGLVVVAALVVVDVVQLGSVPLPVVSAALVLAVLMWATMLRPRVSVRAGVLVLRNAFSTVTMPLAAVEDLTVRQVLAVRTARGRYVAAGVGRSVRQAVRSPSTPASKASARPSLGGTFGGDNPSQVESGMSYADFVEVRLRDLAQEDRDRRGVRAYSPQTEALADELVRVRAVPEIVALAATTLLFAVALVVALL